MKKPLIPYRLAGAMTYVLNKTRSDFATMSAVDLTLDEFLDAFVEEDHRPTLRALQQLGGAIVGSPHGFYSTVQLDGPKTTQIAVSLNTITVRKMTFPAYIVSGLASSCPQPLKERIVGKLEQYVSVVDDLRELGEACEELRETCKSIKQIHALLPAHQVLLAKAYLHMGNEKAADDVANMPVGAPALPPISPEKKARYRDISATYSAVQLLDLGKPSVPKTDVRIVLSV